MRVKWLLGFLFLAACQTTQQKNAAILKDRVDKLQNYSQWKPVKCQVETELSAPQKIKYRTAFADESELLENWNVTYEWVARHSSCSIHVKPLTPMTANQKTFVEEAFCTLLRAFWIHSPFDGLRVLPTDVIDQDTKIFLRQKYESDVGIYLDKEQFSFETKTSRNGSLFARYAPNGNAWLPVELRHETPTFKFVAKDFVWNDNSSRTPPSSFWIYVGEMGATEAHTKIRISGCTPY